MTRKTMGLSEEVHQYLLANGVREADVLAQLRQETASHPMARMQISPDQGAFLAMLARLLGAKRCIEVGVFTGYSSLAVALALPPEGTILACDISEEYTAIARRYWEQAGVSNKINLVLAPADQTLADRVAAGERGAYDFAFIDADKEGYERYYELCLDLLRPGGLMAVDNVLWSGAVADDTDQSESTVALRNFNAARRNDTRVDLCMLAVADGISLLRKR